MLIFTFSPSVCVCPLLSVSVFCSVLQELFRNLDPQVIARRRQVLEEYMTRIVVALPSILRSELFNHFLSISDRTAAIRTKLQAAPSSAEHSLHSNPMLPSANLASPSLATPAPAPAVPSSSSSSPPGKKGPPADAHRLPPLPEAMASETNPMKAAAAGSKGGPPPHPSSSSSSYSSSSSSSSSSSWSQSKKSAALLSPEEEQEQGAALWDEDTQVG